MDSGSAPARERGGLDLAMVHVRLVAELELPVLERVVGFGCRVPFLTVLRALEGLVHGHVVRRAEFELAREEHVALEVADDFDLPNARLVLRVEPENTSGKRE